MLRRSGALAIDGRQAWMKILAVESSLITKTRYNVLRLLAVAAVTKYLVKELLLKFSSFKIISWTEAVEPKLAKINQGTMIVSKSVVASLFLLVGSCEAALRNGHKNQKIKRMVGDAQTKEVFKDDEGFWMRFVQEVSASIPTTPPGTCSGSVSCSCWISGYIEIVRLLTYLCICHCRHPLIVFPMMELPVRVLQGPTASALVDRGLIPPVSN